MLGAKSSIGTVPCLFYQNISFHKAHLAVSPLRNKDIGEPQYAGD